MYKIIYNIYDGIYIKCFVIFLAVSSQYKE